MKPIKIRKLNTQKNKNKIIVILIGISMLVLIVFLYLTKDSTNKNVCPSITQPLAVMDTYMHTPMITPSPLPTNSPLSNDKVNRYIVNNVFDSTLALWIKPNMDNKHMCLTAQYLSNGDIIAPIGDLYTDIYGNIFMPVDFNGEEYWVLYYEIEPDEYYVVKVEVETE